MYKRVNIFTVLFSKSEINTFICFFFLFVHDLMFTRNRLPSDPRTNTYRHSPSILHINNFHKGITKILLTCEEIEVTGVPAKTEPEDSMMALGMSLTGKGVRRGRPRPRFTVGIKQILDKY